MAADARHQAPKTPRAPTIPANRGSTLTPEDIAEFMDSIKEDEVLSAAAHCDDDDPEYND
jgi:hypothetical protein